MKSRLVPLVVLSFIGAFYTTTAQAQGSNPPYLREMPNGTLTPAKHLY